MLMYAIVLTMTGRVKTELTELRARYATYMKYSIEPHVSIRYPFTLRVDISTIHVKLVEIARQTKPFTLVLNGIRYWEGQNNVAYVAIKNRPPVFNLHVALTHALQGLITGDTTYDLENFIPHLTICEGIPSEILPTLKEELSKYDPNYKVRMTSFVLFQAESNEKSETWKRTRVFRFLNL